MYTSAVEERLFEMVKYVRESPEMASEVIFKQLNVENEEQFNEFVSDQLFKIGRQ